MTISLKADSSGTFGEVLVNGSPALKVSNGLLELPDGKDFFNQGNIVGTVSQSGGIPTGAVVERGSNANGDYVRFADGTQICTASTGGGSSLFTWTFPAAFVAAPVVSGQTFNNNTASPVAVLNCQVNIPTVSSVAMRKLYTAYPNGTTYFDAVSENAMVSAIGRWF